MREGWHDKALGEVCEISRRRRCIERKINAPMVFVARFRLGYRAGHFSRRWLNEAACQSADSYDFADGDVRWQRSCSCVDDGSLARVALIKRDRLWLKRVRRLLDQSATKSNRLPKFFQYSFQSDGIASDERRGRAYARLKGIYRNCIVRIPASPAPRTTTHRRHSGRGLCGAGDRDRQRREKSQERP